MKWLTENWPIFTAGVFALVVVGAGWFLYNDNVRRIEDKTIVECNIGKVEQELLAEKERYRVLELRSAELRGILAEREKQLAEKAPFIEKVRTVTVTKPDEKMSEGAAEALDLLNERAANVK